MGYMARICGIGLSILLGLAAPASAGVPHVVQPGESLWSIAAQNNFTTRALAAANGLSESSNVVLGSTIQIPSVYEAEQALAHSGWSSGSTQTSSAATSSSSGGHYVQPGETLSGIAVALGVSQSALAAANGLSPDAFVIAGTTLRVPGGSGTSTGTAAPEPLGGYKVRPGETLSGIAMAAHVSPQAIAFMNGLDPNGVLLAGTVLKLPTGAQAPSSAPAPAVTVIPQAAPNPTNETVTSAQIAQVAAANGVPASMASAIAWQESG